MDREIVVDAIYSDFQGKLYKVIAETESSNGSDEMVVYREVGNDSYTYIDKKEDFLAAVEDGVENLTGQEYRFELVENTEGVNVDETN